MTSQDIRVRLKHIGGLCYSLAMDIGQQIDETEELKSKVTELANELAAIKASPDYKRAKQYEAGKRRREKAQRQKSCQC